MKEYLKVANSPIFYIITFILFAIIIVQVFVFIRMALKRAKQLNITHSQIKSVVKTASVTTVVPSIATVIALLTLVPIMGLPFSWARLSVIGSLSYELAAANMGADAMGVALGQSGYTMQAFLNSVWTMTIGSSVMITFTLFFFKKYKQQLSKSMEKNRNSNWSKMFISAVLLGVYAKFILEPVVSGGSALAAMLTSAVFALIIEWFIKKTGFRWLQDFSLSISMICGMAAACLL